MSFLRKCTQSTKPLILQNLNFEAEEELPHDGENACDDEGSNTVVGTFMKTFMLKEIIMAMEESSSGSWIQSISRDDDTLSKY